MTRYTVHFAGDVQGVGFRFTTVDIAANYQVAGYVQNLPDRRVLVVAEGEKDQLDAFVAAICKRLGNCIRDHTIDQSAASGGFGAPGTPGTPGALGAFDIRY